MRQQIIGYNFTGSAGTYLHATREKCIGFIQPTPPAELNANVSACMLDSFTELDKALFSWRQYILTLWPAFVGAIVALAPDPSLIIYDNIGWSALFAITCGGLPSLDGSNPPHHIEALSEQDWRSKCESWEYTASKPRDMSKTDTMGDRTRGRNYVVLEWVSFAISFALYTMFCVYFLRTLRPAVDFIYYSKDWPRGAIWYLISCGPAVAGAIFELMHNRIELFEPASVGQGAAQVSHRTGAKQTVTASVTASGEITYTQVKSRSIFHLWYRIGKHQWRRSKYRILVRDPPSHWFFLFGRAFTGIGRVAIFATGSVVMGNILFMPAPDDFYLFLLLLFTTAVPRQLWSGLWSNGNRGADLVVFVKSIRLAGVD
ncbi:MAG: hypothetical protein Q9222_007735 [Ikaeria aurantiellina]